MVSLVNKLVRIEQLRVAYKQGRAWVPVLAGVDLLLEPGQTCAIIGPSGCGKSTLLYMLAGLFHCGEVEVSGRVNCPERNRVALILQDYGLLPWKTVWDNTSLGLTIRGAAAQEIRAVVTQILTELGLWELRSRFPAQLSGGQRQRVAIARALAINPELLLMDEPFSSLDALTRESLQETLLAIWQKTKMSLILVTHNIEEAVLLGQRVLIMSPGPARILYVLENKAVGEPGYRKQRAYFTRCLEVRELLEQGMRPGQAGCREALSVP